MAAVFTSAFFAAFLLIALTRSVIGSVDLNCPEPCRCSADLQEVICHGLSLSEFPRGIPASVVTLDLGSNNIETISSSDLKDLELLETIYLNSNRISSIPASCFQHNIRLKDIFLDDNLLDVIPGNIFGETNNLTSLGLSHNRISSINEENLSHLKALRFFNLAGNRFAFLPYFFFKSAHDLLELNLSSNHLVGSFNLLTERPHGLRKLDLSNNKIASLFVTSAGFPQLYALDLSRNAMSAVDSDWFSSFASLRHLNLTRNPVVELSENAFVSCPKLEKLVLNELHDLEVIDRNAFAGLQELKELEICGNLNLVKIHSRAFSELQRLQTLLLQNNSLSFLYPATVSNLSSLRFLGLSGNRWRCDCSNKDFLESLKPMTKERPLVISEFVCSQPEDLSGCRALDVDVESLSCEVTYKVGSVGTLDCPVYEESFEEVTWVTNRLRRYDLVLDHHEELRKGDSSSPIPETPDRFRILSNGSLVISSVARRDGGPYQCMVRNQNGNWSRTVIMKLDYTVVSTVFIRSLIIGFSSAATFFGIALLFGAIRRCAFACSKQERAKRKSIHEVLNSIRNGTQMDRLSAYKTAKMGKFSAFRSATLDQLSAFTTAKISKLRTYKQMTVTNVLQHLERMRQHYAMQTLRIKDNCSVQVERLRENYASQKERLRGQRSQQMRKMRDNYNSQALKIREYRTQQMLRLREQYKLQQQHLLKLLELLDIGNCITVIEAECVRTESTIFDADIAFDIEAKSIRVPPDDMSHSSIELGDISESSSLTFDRISTDAKEEEEEGFEVPQLEDILSDKYEFEDDGLGAPLGGLSIDAIFESCYGVEDRATDRNDRKEIAKETPGDRDRSPPGRNTTTTNVIHAQIETSTASRIPSLVVEGDGEVVVETVF